MVEKLFQVQYSLPRCSVELNIRLYFVAVLASQLG
jgi:hypothetical protein